MARSNKTRYVHMTRLVRVGGGGVAWGLSQGLTCHRALDTCQHLDGAELSSIQAPFLSACSKTTGEGTRSVNLAVVCRCIRTKEICIVRAEKENTVLFMKQGLDLCATTSICERAAHAGHPTALSLAGYNW